MTDYSPSDKLWELIPTGLVKAGVQCVRAKIFINYKTLLRDYHRGYVTRKASTWTSCGTKIWSETCVIPNVVIHNESLTLTRSSFAYLNLMRYLPVQQEGSPSRPCQSILRYTSHGFITIFVHVGCSSSVKKSNLLLSQQYIYLAEAWW